MDWQGKRVLVTGAGGFIASHLVERLVAEGARVRAFVRYNSRNDPGMLKLIPSDVFSQVEIMQGDLRDNEAVRKAMQSMDTVFHLGALIAIPYSYVNPREVIDVNVMGTLNVLMAARDLGTRRVVHTSTSEVYGTAQYVPIDEKHPLQGQSPYSATKIGADHIAESFYRSFDLPVTIVRPFNTFGPRQSARAVIPTIITQLLNGEESIRLGALRPTRDLLFVLDTVDGFLAIAAAPQTIGEEVNIATQSEISIGDLALKIIGQINPSARIVNDDVRLRPEKSEVERLFGSNEKIQRLTSWKKRYSLDEGLKITIEWFKDRGNINRYKSHIYNV